MSYLSVADVRRASGAPTSLISDEYITSAIAIVEEEMGRWINTKFTPTEKIEFLNGTGNSVIFVTQNPLLSVLSLKTNDTNIDLDDIYVYSPSGKIELRNTASTSNFIAKPQNTIVKYYYGLLADSTTKTTNVSNIEVGSASIEVADSSDFTVNDWVRVIGVDGHNEVAKITAIADSTHITLTLLLTHEAGSSIILLSIPEYIKRYMEIEAALYVAINAIGATYTFNASYSLGELSVVKGVPYTHWQSSVEKLLKERNMRKDRIKIRPHIVM